MNQEQRQNGGTTVNFAGESVSPEMSEAFSGNPEIVYCPILGSLEKCTAMTNKFSPDSEPVLYLVCDNFVSLSGSNARSHPRRLMLFSLDG
jgi:hypothetical protein